MVCGLRHSVRISGDANPIGAYVSSSPYHRIMLDRYSAMEMDLYHRGTVSAYLEICYAPENDKTVTVKRVFEKTEGAPYTFTRYTVNLAEHPAGTIETLHFVFCVDDPQHMTYVNIAKLILKP